jgi:TPR repeat protein
MRLSYRFSHPQEAPLTLRVSWPLFFLVLIAPALRSSLVAGQTQKATGTITSFTQTGFVLSRELKGDKEEITLSFGSQLDDAVSFTAAGDSFTLVTREGKKITLRLGETVSVEYSVENGQNLVESVKGEMAGPQAQIKADKGSARPAVGSGAQEVALAESDSDLLEKARSGDAFSQFRLAGDYEDRGDPVEEARWYRKAADQGESNAQNALGFLYQWGHGVPQSFDQAVAWYRKSAEQGNPNGQGNLAKMLADGTGAAQDFAQAANWYRKSAEQGWAWSQAMLAQLYATGQGVPVDAVSAYMWCILALPAEPAAEHWGCKELLEGVGSKMKPLEIAEAKLRAYTWFEQRSRDPNQKHWAVGPLDAIAPGGVIPDEWPLTGLIGSGYAEGQGVARDDPEALKWFQLGAERGDAPAEWYLGERYYRGKGVPKDRARAFTLFKQSAEQGWAYGEHDLATAYLQGIGTAKDAAEALKWFRKGAEQGDPASLHDLGAMYAMGMGVPPNYVTAWMWLRIGQAAGHRDSDLDALQAHLTGEQLAQARQGAAQWFLAHDWRTGYQAALASMYAGGEGVPKNFGDAAKWARRAAENGNASAQFLLGSLYETGRGVPKDEATAAIWYLKAAEQGDAFASNNLALMYATSKDPKMRRPQEALMYALKAVGATKEEYAGFLGTLAEAYYVNGLYEKAIETEGKALALERKNPSFKESLEKYLRAKQDSSKK